MTNGVMVWSKDLKGMRKGNGRGNIMRKGVCVFVSLVIHVRV